jgi:hypothetical protein
MTNQELLELREKATQGEWREEGAGLVSSPDEWVLPNLNNAHYIAAMHNALGPLLDEVERLREAVLIAAEHLERSANLATPVAKAAMLLSANTLRDALPTRETP